MRFAEGGVAPLVCLEHSRAQQERPDRLPQPAIDLLLGRQNFGHLQEHADLAVVAAHPPYLVPPLPGVCVYPA